MSDSTKVREYLELLKSCGTADIFDIMDRHCADRAALATDPAAQAVSKLVPLCDIGEYTDSAFPLDDPRRIVFLSSSSRDDYTYQKTISKGFMDRYACVVNSSKKFENLVLAGGSLLNEVVSQEEATHESKIRLVDPDDPTEVVERTFMTRRDVSDLDHFIVVPNENPNRIKEARKIACAAVTQIDPGRFAPDYPPCALCGTDIVGGWMYSCLSFETHKFHKACSDSQHGRHCPSEGCLCQNMNLELIKCPMVINVTRTTLNIIEPSTNKILYQMPSRLFESRRQVVFGFDLGPSQIFMDSNGDVFLTELAAYCIANRVIVVGPFTMSINCEHRILKYVKRYGFDLYIPGVDSTSWSRIKSGFSRGSCGLKKLAELDETMTSLTSAWREFGSQVRKNLKGVVWMLRHAAMSSFVQIDMDPEVLSHFACPYVPNDVEVMASINYWAGSAYGFEKDLESAIVATKGEGISDDELGFAMQRVLLLQKGLRGHKLRLIAAAGTSAAPHDCRETEIQKVVEDAVRMMMYNVVNPGAQAFVHAQIGPAAGYVRKSQTETSPVITAYEGGSNVLAPWSLWTRDVPTIMTIMGAR